ncbi:MAG: hypothetical protein ACP5IM_06390 [Candidatus Bathyarchaeia archaeon]
MSEPSKFELEMVVKVRKWLHFTNITICLDKIGYNLASEGQKRLFRLIYEYITSHRGSKTISRQSFAFGPDVVAFTVLTKDLPRIQQTITNILQKPNSLTKKLTEVSNTSLLESIFPFLTVKKRRIWHIGEMLPFNVTRKCYQNYRGG